MAALSAVSLNRVSKEIKEVMTAPPAGISAWLPDEKQLRSVEAQIIGPDDTPYVGGLFQLQVHFPDRYPYEPPNVKFRTKVYHPNVAHDGNICLSVLNMPPKGDWKPSHSLRTVLLSIQSLLAHPNPDDPLDADAAKDLKINPAHFRERAADWTRRFASQTGSKPGAAGSSSAPPLSDSQQLAAERDTIEAAPSCGTATAAHRSTADPLATVGAAPSSIGVTQEQGNAPVNLAKRDVGATGPKSRLALAKRTRNETG